MDPRRLWTLLGELAAAQGVEVRVESLRGDDDYRVQAGLCRLGGRWVAFVDRRAGQAGRCRQLGLALMRLGLDDVFVRPALRDYLEGLAEAREEEQA